MKRGFFLLARVLLMGALMSSIAAGAAEDKYQVVVGTYNTGGSQGIYALQFDATKGSVTAPQLAVATENASFLAINDDTGFVYAVNEVENFESKKSGAISVFKMEGAKLKLIQQVESFGGSPAYVTLDHSRKYLLVANYSGGNAAVFPIGKDRRLGPRTAFVQHKGSSVNRERQQGPHAHSIQMSSDNRYAMVADLGLDQVVVYAFDPNRGTLTESSRAKLAPGAGPRHVAFAPSGKFVYVTNELTSTVTVFAFDQQKGTMRELQTIATVKPEIAKKNSTAEIALDKKGRNLYVSNRGEDSIAQFAVDAKTGLLTYVQSTPTGGKTPRFFTFDRTGKWVFAANQDSNDIFLFKVDEETGKLTPTGTRIEIGSPVCVVFVAAK